MMPRLPGKLDWLMPTIILPSFPNSILGRSDGCAALALMVRLGSLGIGYFIILSLHGHHIRYNITFL